MEQESIKEIILFIDSQQDYETFSEIFSNYGTVIKYNKESDNYDETNLIGICLLDDKLNRSNLINFRENYKNVKIIGIFDNDDYINYSNNIFINAFINQGLLEKTKEIKKIIKMLTVDLTETSLNIVLNKKSKAFSHIIKKEENLNTLIEKICNLVSNIKKLDQKILTDIFNNILKINKEEIHFSYGVDKERLAFNINIKNSIGLHTIEDLYNKIFCFENTKNMSLPLKMALLKAFLYFNLSILNIERSGISFTFSLSLVEDESKSINLLGKNFNQKLSIITDMEDEIVDAETDNFDSFMKENTEITVDELGSIEKIIRDKKDLNLYTIDYNNLTIEEVLDLLKKNNEILEKRFYQIIEDYRAILNEKIKTEKISTVLGEEVKDLMKFRKEPTTDAELKDVKRKLDDQIYKLYRDMGVQKAKNSKLVQHINLLKEKIVQSRIGQEKLRTELKEKNKKINLLEQQLQKMEKSLLDF